MSNPSVETLRADAVKLAYGSRVVLDGFSLTLGAGEFVALMGPSGSGKSSFLHAAAGLIGVDAGSISVDGCEITAASDGVSARFRRRKLGVVFQAFNLLNDKTVAENVWMPRKLDGVRFPRRKDDPARVRFDALLAELGLADRLEAKPEELSGGERQRVAIARALVADPALVLADEPTGNLDAPAARDFCGLLKRLQRNHGCSILLVTHDPVVAAAAERVCFLKDGRIAASYPTDGDPAAVSARYLETFE